jgi:Zn-finger nucleic acid-binding protein
MKCPACPEQTLVMADRQGVEIDYCPQCRGVWLDRGELDKLLERSAAREAPQAQHAPAVARPQQRPDFVDSDYRGSQQSSYRRKKSWLSDIFD